MLWYHLRGKRIGGVRFYRQRPIGAYIVDFYAPAPKLVVEVDGGQHYKEAGCARDAVRDMVLEARGLKVLRFSNLEVRQNTEGVAEAIRLEVENRIDA